MEGLTLYFFLISGLIVSLLCFYKAMRVQMYKGIGQNSKIDSLFYYLIIIIIPFLPGQYLFGDSPLITLMIMLILAFISSMIELYTKGRMIVVYETSKRILIDSIRAELERFSISFIEEESEFSDEHFFHLEGNVGIKISSRRDEEEFKTYRVRFIKWWRLYQYQEIKDTIIDTYRKEREEEIFWKEILTNVGFGVLVLGFVSFIAWKML